MTTQVSLPDATLEHLCVLIEQLREKMDPYRRQLYEAYEDVRKQLEERGRRSWTRPDGRKVRVHVDETYDADGERLGVGFWISLEKGESDELV
jgi:hypothetical protein